MLVRHRSYRQAWEEEKNVVFICLFSLWSQSNAGGTRGLWLEELCLSQKNKRGSDFIASEQTAAPENTEKNGLFFICQR